MTRGKKSDLGIYIAPLSSEERGRYLDLTSNGANISTPRFGDGPALDLFFLSTNLFSGYYKIGKVRKDGLEIAAVVERPEELLNARLVLPDNIAESDSLHYSPEENGFNLGLIQIDENASQRSRIRRYSNKSFYEILSQNPGFPEKIPFEYTTVLEGVSLICGEKGQRIIRI
jgi:hypothetical protein